MCGTELAGRDVFGICRPCWENFQPWSGPICSYCGLPLSSAQALGSVHARCADCRREKYRFDWARSYALYSGPLRAAILQLKFRRRERLGRRLGALLATSWSSSAELREAVSPVVIPVPLYRGRERERGFNQAQLLAQGMSSTVARHSGRKTRVEVGCLVRARPTVPQTGLSLQARHRNVQGVFVARFPERLKGRLVVLVDDVMTTGATLSACASALRQAGASRVVALTLARATPQFPDLAPRGFPVDEASGWRT